MVDRFIGVNLFCYEGFELVGIAVAEGDLLSKHTRNFASDLRPFAAVLFMRTYAIWGQSRNVLYVLIFLSSIVIPSAVVMGFDLSTLTFPQSPIPTIIPCVSSGAKSLLYIDYALVLGVEFVVICLTIWIGIKQWRNESNPLKTVLYRDAITFSSILFLTSVANVTVLAGTSSIALHLLLLEPQRVLHSVLTSRIILHLRIASAQQQEERETVPPMDFLPPPGENSNLDSSFNVEATSILSGDGRGNISMATDNVNHSADGIVPIPV